MALENLGMWAPSKTFSKTKTSTQQNITKTSVVRLSQALKNTSLLVKNQVAERPRTALHVAIIAAVTFSVFVGSSGNAQTSVAGLNATESGYGAVIDETSAANVAAEVASKVNLLVASEVTEQATTLNAQVSLPTAGDDYLAKRQVVATAGSDRRDVKKYRVESGESGKLTENSRDRCRPKIRPDCSRRPGQHRLPGPRMHAAQDDVGALAGQRQLVLDQHLDVIEAGLHQVGGQRVQAALPGPDLGRRGRTGQAMPVLLDEPGHQAAVEHLRAELRHSGTVERHDATPEEGRRDLPAGGGSSGVADSLVGPQCLTRRNLRDSDRQRAETSAACPSGRCRTRRPMLSQATATSSTAPRQSGCCQNGACLRAVLPARPARFCRRSFVSCWDDEPFDVEHG